MRSVEEMLKDIPKILLIINIVFFISIFFNFNRGLTLAIAVFNIIINGSSILCNKYGHLVDSFRLIYKR